jgi:hypothetical protein
MIYYARTKRAMVVDASDAVMAIHAVHTPYQATSLPDIYSIEVQRNANLLLPEVQSFTLADATHVVRDGKVMRQMSAKRFLRELTVAHLLYPRYALLLRPVSLAARCLKFVARRLARYF